MRIYIAHNFEARIMLRGMCKALESQGHIVTSRWITDDAHVLASTAAENAMDDLEDIERADALLLFTDQYAERPGRGKFIELGYAIAKCKSIYLCQDKPDIGCVFYHLPDMRVVTSSQLVNGSWTSEFQSL